MILIVRVKKILALTEFNIRGLQLSELLYIYYVMHFRVIIGLVL